MTIFIILIYALSAGVFIYSTASQKPILQIISALVSVCFAILLFCILEGLENIYVD